MTATLFAVLPFFALVLVGFLAARQKIMSPASVQGLNTFVYFFALPALLFNEAAQASIDKVLQESGYAGAYILATACVFGVGYLGAKVWFKATSDQAALMALAGGYANIGFIAIPVLVSLIGAYVAVPLAIIVLIDTAIFVPLAMIIMDMGKPSVDRQKLVQSVWGAVVKNPLILALCAGFISAGLGVGVAVPVNQFLQLLSATAAPVAMFALGAALVGRPISDEFGASIYITVLKLVLHPLAVWFAMGALNVSADWQLAATLGVALPIATSVFVIANEKNVMPARASTAILISTLVSIVSLTLTIRWLAP